MLLLVCPKNKNKAQYVDLPSILLLHIHTDKHTYKSKLGELQVEPLLGSFLCGEGLHGVVVACFCNNIIL